MRFVVKAQLHSTEAVIGPLVGVVAAEAALAKKLLIIRLMVLTGAMRPSFWAIYSQLKNDRVVLSLITIPLASISGLA